MNILSGASPKWIVPFEAIAREVPISFSEKDDLSELGLDSLDKLKVVMVLEKKFGKTIPFKSIRMSGFARYTVGEFIDDVAKELGS